MKLRFRNNKIFCGLVVIAITMALLIPMSFSASAVSIPTAQGKVNDNNVNLRSGPSTKTKVLNMIDKNAKVIVYQEVFTSKNKYDSKNKWYKVKVASKSGYIRSDLVNLTKHSSTTAWTTDELNYRFGAGVSMKLKGTFSKSAKVSVVLSAKDNSSNKTWYKIKKNSAYYYVRADWISFSKPKTEVKKTPTSSSATAYKADYNASASSNKKSSDSSANKTVVKAQSAYAKKVADGACKWAVKIANDNSFHYGNGKHSHHNGCYFCNTQPYSKQKYVVKWQKTYCCNPFVTAAYAHGGKEEKMLSLCKSGRSWMAPQFKKSIRFQSLGHPKQSELKRGDILCVSNHVALYLGDGKIAEAASSDNGKPGTYSWNSSIRVTTLTARRYKGFNAGVFRYIGVEN